METHTLFISLVIILITARLFGEISSRISVPPVVGELLAGVVLGPSLLGWIQPTEVLHLLAEIGIIMLLFQVGLETDVDQLVKAGTRATIVAIGGFIMPFILGFLAGYYVFDLSLLISLFLGGTLTATSIGITVRVLSDLKRQNSPESQIILGAAVIDDVLGVVLLALLYEYSIAGGVSLLNTSKILFFIIVFFLVAPIMAKTISHLIKHFELNSEIPGMIPVAMVSLVMFFAWIAHTLGAPELMGGFAAGLALSRRFFLPFGAALSHDPGFSHRIESQMQPIIQITTPIFFVMIGVSLDLASIDWSVTFIWLFFLLFLVIAVVSKFSGALVLNIPMVDRIAIGLAMIPRGEVGLIFAGLGLSAGIFDNDLYAGMIIVIAITTILSPLALKWHYRRYGEKIGNELIGRIDKPS